MNTKPGRARPLAPDERRTAILNAVIPLLIEEGAAVTTAEMAAAAGIAEGTIFRVFPDKAALLRAAIKTKMDPSLLQASLDEIDEDSPIERQLCVAADSLSKHFEGVTALLGMLRSIQHHGKPHAESHRIATEAMTAIVESLARLMERHREQLAVEPTQAAIVLRGLVFTNTHHMLASGQKMTTEQLVSILLGGILAPEANRC